MKTLAQPDNLMSNFLAAVSDMKLNHQEHRVGAPLAGKGRMQCTAECGFLAAAATWTLISRLEAHDPA